MNNILPKISLSAKEINQDACIIGRYVISFILKNKIYKYIDILTEGSGYLLAQKVYKKYYHHLILTFFKRFNTTRVKNNGKQIEFIGYNDIIIYQRYTISISLNVNYYGIVMDTLNINIFYGKTISMIRSICLSSELQFTEQISFYSLFSKREHVNVIYIEIIINDLNKIIVSQHPYIELSFLYDIGLLSILLPEVTCLKDFKVKEGSNHKENLFHTIEVINNVSVESNSLWLRWSALLHDIGKYITKKYIHGIGWTFHSHECLGARMIPYLFHRLKFPMDYTMEYVQKMIQYSSRPITLASYDTTDSSIRRLLFYVGEEIEDLMLLCKADITTKKIEKKLRYMNNFYLVKNKLKYIDLKDNYIKFTTPISGDKIMQYFQIQPSTQVGLIKKSIKESILNGKFTNNFISLYSFIN